MQRSLNALDVATMPIPEIDADAEPRRWQRLVPLWRYAVWAAALFLVCAAAVAVRVDVQQLHKDLDRNGRLEREARVLNERLRLERDARRNAVAVQAIATEFGLTADARIVRLQEP
jgi:hypothetical protein